MHTAISPWASGAPCAPAPMLIALAWLAGRSLGARRDDPGRVAILTGLGAGLLCGMVSEPITREVVLDPRAQPDRTVVVAVNVVLPAVMVVAGLVHLARSRHTTQGP
jgi:hypothetical protein